MDVSVIAPEVPTVNVPSSATVRYTDELTIGPGMVGTVVATRLPRASGCVEGDPRAALARELPAARAVSAPGLASG